MGAVTSWFGIAPIAVCVLESYAPVFVAIYAWKAIAAVPLLLNERNATIERLEDSQRPRFLCMIQTMSIYEHHATPFERQTTPTMARLNISLQLQIRSLGAPPTTMHDFTLHLLGERPMTLPDGSRMQVATGALAERSFYYDPPMIGGEQSAQIRSASEWKMTFKESTTMSTRRRFSTIRLTCLIAFSIALSNVFRSKWRNSSRNFSSLARCFSLGTHFLRALHVGCISRGIYRINADHLLRLLGFVLALLSIASHRATSRALRRHARSGVLTDGLWVLTGRCGAQHLAKRGCTLYRNGGPSRHRNNDTIPLRYDDNT